MRYKDMLSKAARISRDGWKVVMWKAGRSYDCAAVANTDDPVYPGATGYYEAYGKLYPRETGWDHDSIREALDGNFS
jgi:hypothetical protein